MADHKLRTPAPPRVRDIRNMGTTVPLPGLREMLRTKRGRVDFPNALGALLGAAAPGEPPAGPWRELRKMDRRIGLLREISVREAGALLGVPIEFVHFFIRERLIAVRRVGDVQVVNLTSLERFHNRIIRAAKRAQRRANT